MSETQRPSPNAAGLSGLFLVDKPLGWSSMRTVRRVKAAAGRVRTGHAGTLDPLATGLLICCLGKATRLAEQLMGLTKVYQAQVDLSAFTESDDRETPPQPVNVDRPPEEGRLRQALAGFVGVVLQTPPMHSAVHVEGKRAYKLARRGEAVPLTARPVRIDAIELLGYQWPLADLRITCGKGTYIRSLARDLGQRLGTGGHLAGLRRLAVGPYDVSMAVDGRQIPYHLTVADLVQPVVDGGW